MTAEKTAGRIRRMILPTPVVARPENTGPLLQLAGRRIIC